MKKLLAAFALSLLTISSALAQAVPAPAIGAKSWLLLDFTSDQIIGSKNANDRVEPASLTKIMTAYLTFIAIRDKKLSLDQKINVSVAAWKTDPGGSKMFIDPAVPVSVKDLLYGLMVQSGNDAAIALAEAVAGDEGTFATLMNREAQRLGMKSSHFVNSHGLPHPDHYTTAGDLAILATHVIHDFPEFYKIDSVKSFKYNNIDQPNRNRLLWLDPTVDGMKTGHTESAGYCLIASAKRPNGSGERRLVAILLGANSDQARAQEGQKLLNWGFQNFDTIKLYSKDQPIASPRIWKGNKNQINIGFTKDVYVTIPKGMATKIQPLLERQDPLIAPVGQNNKAGTLKVVLDGKSMAEFPVLALEDVPQTNIFGRAWDSVRLWMK